MKSLITLTAVLAAMLSVSAAANALPLDTSVKPAVTSLSNPAPKTGLYVGNSFTYYNCGLVGYVRGFAKAAGIPWRARQITISSGRLSYHPMAQYLAPHELDPYAKGKVKDGKLTAPMFDVVFIQALSTEPIDAKSIPTWKKYLKSEVAEVKAAGSEPVVVVTWAKKDHPEDTKKLADSIISAANENGAAALPGGPAFAEAHAGRPDINFYAPDKRHPSAAGSYLYGAVAYSFLFHRSPEGLKFLGGCDKPLSEADAAYLQSVAWKTVRAFYGW